MKKKTLVVFTLISLLSFASFISAPARKWYSFDLILPEFVEGKPGENVTVEGGILNTGLFWLRKFNLTVSNLPYEYEVEPSFFKYIRILREWNPERGVYRVPVNFTIKISIPENAVGVHLVNVTGTEGSWKKVSASSLFILKVLTNITIKPNVTISELMLPETVKANESFNLTFKINNFEPIDLTINASILVPEGWEVEKTKSVLVKTNSSEELGFIITPSNTSGNVSIYLEYPYGLQKFNLTTYGTFLVPEKEIPKIEKPEEVPSITARIIEAIRGVSPIIIAIIVLLAVIIIWNIVKIYHFYARRKKPEKIKKSKESAETQQQSLQS